MCTNNVLCVQQLGCTLSWDGYLTLVQCTNKCKSVSCTNTGCEYYNSPGSVTEINGNYGSGGTWTGGMGLRNDGKTVMQNVYQQIVTDTQIIYYNKGVYNKLVPEVHLQE